MVEGHDIRVFWAPRFHFVAIALLAALLSLVGFSHGAKAETLDWATRPNVSILSPAAPDVATPAIVTVTSSAVGSGSTTARRVEIQPTGTIDTHTGIILSEMDATTDNLSVFNTTTLAFSNSVYNLCFTITDIDGSGTTSSGGSNFNDIVQFGPVPTSAPTIGSNVNYNAGTGRATSNGAYIGDTTGDLRVCFAGPVSTVTIQHIAGGVNGTNPTNEYIAIDDLTYTPPPTVTLTKVSNGGVGGFTFTGTNGWSSQTLTTVTSGVGVTGARQTLTAASTATTITETIPAGYVLASATCSGMGSGGTATPNLSTGALVLNTAATAAGSNIACTFTNTRLPTITLTKVSNGAVGGFTFNGDNGFGAAQTITTVTSGVGVSGATRTLAAASTTTTITETIPAGYVLASATCSGMGSGGTATPNLSTGALVLNTAATAAGSNIACTFTNTRLPTITLTKVSNGAVGGFTFNGDNGFGAAQTITTVTSGVGVSGATRTLAAASTTTTITETIPAGYVLASATCSGMGSGGTATPNLSTGALVLNTAATAAGSNIACTFTNTRLPTITLTKVSNGAVGGFTFNGDNGFGAAQTITTVTSGVGVSGATRTLAAASTTTTITETIPAGYVLASATCSGMGSGGTATPNLSTGALVLNTAATAAGSNIACTFTNTRLPTITLTKVSNGAVGGFTFNGDNGFGAAQTITTVTSGVGVSGATRTLAAASTTTTITETIPAGYVLASATCSGMGSGGTATPNLSTGALVLNTAATAAGSNIACTFTNTRLPTITLTKVSNGAVGGFTFNGDNGFGAAQTITTVTSGVGVSGATRTLAAASTTTTITETIPAGYVLASATCSGMGSGGTATPNLSTGALVLNTAATAAGSNIACTFTNTRLPTITLTKVSNGAVGGFTFNGDNGFGAAQTITTVTSGVGVSGATRTLAAASTTTTITETIPAGYVLASATCSGMGSGGTATPNLSTGALVLNTAATAAGSNIACTFTNTRLPTITLTKVSNGAVGGFTFNGDNGFGAAQTITTVTSGVGVSGATRTLAAASTTTTITETIPAGYVLASATCSGMGSGGTATPNLSTGALVLNTAATAAGSNIACTFTNTRLPTITLTKVSNGAVGGFTFNGDNGFGAAQTITTVTSGVGVSGATRTLAAASTTTTITETIPAGYTLASISCSGLGSGGTATPNLSTGAVVFDVAATAAGSSIACTYTNTRLPTVTLTKISNGAVGGFTFTGNNGWSSQTITTITSGVGVAGATQTFTTAATSTTITETIPAGYALASVSCSGLGSGGTATSNLSTGAVVFDAAATAAGSNIACTFTNTRLPTVTLTKVSNGGVGGFTFTGTNGWSSQTITTVTSGVGVNGATQTLTAAATSTTITETIPAGYTLASVSCTGLGSGGTATPNLGTGALVLDAAAAAAGANIACTFTNTQQPTLTLTKVSIGGVGGFTFTGNNGWSSQTIITVTSGVGVAGATQTLATASTATTITEVIPAGYALTSATCSGLGSGGTATPNLATGALVLDAAATASGSAIACTFTNTKLPTVVLTKISNGGVGGFTFSGTNGWASQTITTITSGSAVTGATQTLTAAATATTITETIPAGYTLASVSCSGLGSGGTATPNLSTGDVVFDAAAMAAGTNIACTFTNNKQPTLTLTKISNGAVGGFTFTGNNGWSSQTITTLISGVGVTGTTQTLIAAATSTTITEAIPAGYALTAVSCSGLGPGGTATPNLSMGALVFDTAATAAGSNIACTFTNTRLPTVTLTKISNGGVGGFTFTGTNGWAGQTITTVISGFGVAGATQALAAASTSTTITETIPMGYALSSVSCSGLGSGGTATPNLSTGAVVFDGAATTAGSDIACTFTNTRLPTVTLTKISNGAVGDFDFTGTNGWAEPNDHYRNSWCWRCRRYADSGDFFDLNYNYRTNTRGLRVGFHYMLRSGGRHGHSESDDR